MELYALQGVRAEEQPDRRGEALGHNSPRALTPDSPTRDRCLPVPSRTSREEATL